VTGAVIAALAYAAMAFCAWRVGPFHEHLALYWVLHAAAFTGMVLAARGRGRGRGGGGGRRGPGPGSGSGSGSGSGGTLGARGVLLGAVVFRALLIPLTPSLSDDIYRYVWEGRVQNAGFDPYVIPPDAASLEPLRDSVWEHVNHREYTAIYPPLAQLVFRGLALAGGVTVFKLALSGIDILAVWLLLRALRRANLPARRAVWYAWNPLAVVEVAGSGHFEPLALAPLVAAVGWAHPARPVATRWAWGQARAWAAFAAGISVKYAALAALPAFLRHAPPRGRALLAAGAVAGACFAAYAGSGSHLFDSLRAYAEHWRFNDFAFAWLRTQVDDPLRARRLAAITIAAIAVTSALAARSLAGAACGGLLGALLCAPTVHPWYLLWPLVLVPLCTSRAVIVWSATIPLAYHFFYPAAGHAAAADHNWTLRWLEMAPVGFALCWDLVAWRRGRSAAPAALLPAEGRGRARAIAPQTPPLPPQPRVALVMPALDEEEPLPLVFADLESLRRDRPAGSVNGVIGEIVLVDNGSRDRTASIARAAGATVLREDARGYGVACLRALAHLRREPPDIVLFMDADRSDDAQDIRALLRPLLAGEADLVIGSRTRGVHEPGALLPQARFGNWLATGWIRLWYGFQYTDLGPFRAIRWDGLEKLAMRDRDWGWTLEMQVRALQEGLRVVEVPVRYRRRVGTSKISGTLLGSYRAGKKILWMMWTLRRPVRQDERAPS